MGVARKRARATASRRAPRTQFPDGFSLSDADRAYASKFGLDPEIEAERFENKAKAEGWTKADWHQAFRCWCDMEIKFAAQRGSKGAAKNGHASSERGGWIDPLSGFRFGSGAKPPGWRRLNITERCLVEPVNYGGGWGWPEKTKAELRERGLWPIKNWMLEQTDSSYRMPNNKPSQAELAAIEGPGCICDGENSARVRPVSKSATGNTGGNRHAA